MIGAKLYAQGTRPGVANSLKSGDEIGPLFRFTGSLECRVGRRFRPSRGVEPFPMNAVTLSAKPAPYQPKHKVRFVTATSLFDGHDASVNIMRRVLQASGAEVIHLGHNRSVQEIVSAAVQETCRAWPSPPIRAGMWSSSST